MRFFSFSFFEKAIGTSIETTPKAKIIHANSAFMATNDVPFITIEKQLESIPKFV